MSAGIKEDTDIFVYEGPSSKTSLPSISRCKLKIIYLGVDGVKFH